MELFHDYEIVKVSNICGSFLPGLLAILATSVVYTFNLVLHIELIFFGFLTMYKHSILSHNVFETTPYG